MLPRGAARTVLAALGAADWRGRYGEPRGAPGQFSSAPVSGLANRQKPKRSLLAVRSVITSNRRNGGRTSSAMVSYGIAPSSATALTASTAMAAASTASTAR